MHKSFVTGLDDAMGDMLQVQMLCEQIKSLAEDIAPKIFAADDAIDLASQLARGAKNRVQGVCFDAGKYAMISKPKLNELKKALRKVGVKI